jgi:hypothetical protein
MIFSQFKAMRIAELLQEQWGDRRIPGLLDVMATAKPDTVLEIGSYIGVSTELFLLHCRAVTAVDPWDSSGEGGPEQYREFMIRCRAYPHLEVCKGLSLNVMGVLNSRGSRYDLVYIDGDHSYDVVMADINDAAQLSKGWIGGHDYQCPGTPDVERAVHHFWNPSDVLTYSDGSWLARKENMRGPTK